MGAGCSAAPRVNPSNEGTKSLCSCLQKNFFEHFFFASFFFFSGVEESQVLDVKQKQQLRQMLRLAFNQPKKVFLIYISSFLPWRESFEWKTNTKPFIIKLGISNKKERIAFL